MKIKANKRNSLFISCSYCNEVLSLELTEKQEKKYKKFMKEHDGIILEQKPCYMKDITESIENKE